MSGGRGGPVVGENQEGPEGQMEVRRQGVMEPRGGSYRYSVAQFISLSSCTDIWRKPLHDK